MIGFVAQCLMDIDVENRSGAARAERSDARKNFHNGHRERDWARELALWYLGIRKLH